MPDLNVPFKIRYDTQPDPIEDEVIVLLTQEVIPFDAFILELNLFDDWCYERVELMPADVNNDALFVTAIGEAEFSPSGDPLPATQLYTGSTIVVETDLVPPPSGNWVTQNAGNAYLNFRFRLFPNMLPNLDPNEGVPGEDPASHATTFAVKLPAGPQSLSGSKLRVVWQRRNAIPN